MTRKDYQVLASALHDVQPELITSSDDRYGAAYGNQWQACVSAIADALAKDNPRFDRTRFLVACNGGKK